MYLHTLELITHTYIARRDTQTHPLEEEEKITTKYASGMKCVRTQAKQVTHTKKCTSNNKKSFVKCHLFSTLSLSLELNRLFSFFVSLVSLHIHTFEPPAVFFTCFRSFVHFVIRSFEIENLNSYCESSMTASSPSLMAVSFKCSWKRCWRQNESKEKQWGSIELVMTSLMTIWHWNENEYKHAWIAMELSGAPTHALSL